MSSRLFTEIRERRGLAYYVRTATSNYLDTGNFVIQAGIRLGSLAEALETIYTELRKMKNEPVSAKELSKAKEYLKGTLTLSLEASEARLAWYLEQTAFRKKVLEPEGAFARIDKITSRDIARVARDIFQSRKLSCAIVGQKPNQATLQRLLKTPNLV